MQNEGQMPRQNSRGSKESFYEILLNAAADRKQSSKRMPEDVREMLGMNAQETNQVKSSRGRSKTKLKPETSPPVAKKKREKEFLRPHTVKEKFEQQAKRKVIDEYLNTPKKRLLKTETCPIPFRQKSAKEQKISVLKLISDTVPPSNPSSESTQKHDLSDIIIAAAAAKMVKLDSEGCASLLKCSLYNLFS
jgi:hypothetical protein